MLWVGTCVVTVAMNVFHFFSIHRWPLRSRDAPKSLNHNASDALKHNASDALKNNAPVNLVYSALRIRSYENVELSSYAINAVAGW